MRWGVVILLVGCGGTVGASDAGTPADSGKTDAPSSKDAMTAFDASACLATAGDVGNCFSNFQIDSPVACGFPIGGGAGSAATCGQLCGTSIKCCTFDGAQTVRCEYCACP